jgi:molecular chaperone DnaK
MKIRKTVGIDLGTTNSVIALLDATDTVILTGQDEQGRKTFPSVVGYQEGRTVAGRPAAALKGQPAAPVTSVKRFMGLDRLFPVGPDALAPTQVSARILTLLRDVMARTLNDGRYLLDSAIITMPAYFNHNQIEATRQAGELAGYEVVELLHEPTAAAIYYSWIANHSDATYLVYDLGGGTFDVSVIRKRLGDYEVLSVSGDPFLGGDDFDRLLASDLQERLLSRGNPGSVNFDLATPEGSANFARLVQVAEGIKIELSERDAVSRYVPGLIRDAQRGGLALEVEVERTLFQRLIKDKVDRTIACCHEALGRARDKIGIQLGDIDHVILAGGSSRIPLVRDTVRAAFCNPALPEHVRNPEPLLHEPDLCVAYGAALRAGSYGTRYLFDLRLAQLDGPSEVELHITSPCHVQQTAYQLTGVVRLRGSQSKVDLVGGSVRVRLPAAGLVEEAFLDDRGTFCQELGLRPESDNALELTVCDASGRDLARVPFRVRHQGDSRHLGHAVLPTQLITKPLQIEVLNHSRQRVRQVLAPVGATLPGTFACTCRTVDQSGRIVVPILEENRAIKEMVVADLAPDLPVGSPVDVEFHIDVKHNIQVRVLVRQAGLSETAFLSAPPPPQRPTRTEIDEVRRRIDALLTEFSGSYRTRVKAEVGRLLQDLNEALGYEDEPKAIQRMAELRDLLQQLETNRSHVLDPPWPRFAQMVKHCLHLAADVAQRTGRAREELFEQVYAQERYAERAYEEKNQPLYRECFENLHRYAGYLDQVQRDALPRSFRGPAPSPEQEATEGIDYLQACLAAVLEKARAKDAAALVERVNSLIERGRGLRERIQADAPGVVREVRRTLTEVQKIERELLGPGQRPAGADAGLLEGTA